jgi:pilus assembly protein CpaF
MPLKGQWSPELLTSLAPVLPLLEDEEVTEVEANAFDEIWIKSSRWRGHRRAPGVSWKDNEDLRIACIRISDVIGRTISERRPILNARLPGGERVNIAIPPACEKVALTVRKFPAETMTFDTLETKHSVNRTVRQICEALVLTRQSIIVAGGTGAGKTSLLNALSRMIPGHERLVTIEDARELQIQQPNWVAMETVEPFQEGAPAVTIGDLVKNALRQAPDRIIVGEVRWDEALHLLRALSTGHGGGLGTVHANDAVDALHQLQILAQMAPVGALNPQVVAAMVGRAVDVVIYQRYFETENVRRIDEIIEVARPGVTLGRDGGIEYQVRRLVAWNAELADWVLPEAPSEALQANVRRLGIAWPRGGPPGA